MELIKQSHEILVLPKNQLELIELAGRTCYKSEDRISPVSAPIFCQSRIHSGHESVIEHGFMTVKFITNRGVTHELVRHRLCSFSQESTRYVNYGGTEIQFIRPVWFNGAKDQHGAYTDITSFLFIRGCVEAEGYYNELLKEGWRPEQAREVLPNALKTEIVVTANIREWRHIFKLRTSKKAHPQIRELMLGLLSDARNRVPVVFDI